MNPRYLGQIALLAALYVITGKLGKLLAVPPGYATIIWPASGIALGMLIALGPRLWPGVFIGSLALDALNSGGFLGPEWFTPGLGAALLIAVVATLQPLAGRALIARLLGLPLRLETRTQIALLLLLAGPITCVIAATLGVGVLYAFGSVSSAEVFPSWLAWWLGDTFGVLVFMPLVLLAPGSRNEITWRRTSIGRLPLAALVLLLLPLGLTFYAWQATSEYDYQRGMAKFETLTIESEKAVQNRIASYGSALLGAAAFVQGSSNVSRAEWRTYVDTIRLRENFPGINGIGWIERVADADLDKFVRDVRADGAPGFTIHPQRASGPNYIIRFVDPEIDNYGAIGLNIAFEAQRLAAAERARDSGAPAMTGHVVLVTDVHRSPGFVMLYPIYHRDRSLSTIEDRRAALRGWAVAPFIATATLDGLTHAQDSEYRLRIYDGAVETPDAFVYASGAASNSTPKFTARSTLEIMQRRWLLVWESTPAFELAERSANPTYILIGGLLFTVLLALLIIVLAVRRIEHIEQVVGERRFAVPLLVFLVVAAGSVALYSKLRGQELEFIRRQVQDQAGRIGSLLRSQANERIATLARMAERWEPDDTEYRLWRRDAANHIAQLPGLRALEWIDSAYRVRWVEPLAGNEGMIGRDVLHDGQPAAVLQSAGARQRITLTSPQRTLQGYNAVIAYLPLQKDGEFDGFIGGLFAVEDFFHGALRTELSRNYAVSILKDGVEHYSNAAVDNVQPSEWVVETAILIQDQSWTLRVAPTPAFVASQKSVLPSMVLAAGLLVAALSALSVRYILISRLKSAHLAKSLALNAGIISSSAHLVIAIDDQYRITIFNRAAEQVLGYRAVDVLGQRPIATFMDMGEIEERARTLSAEVGMPIAPGPDVLTRIPLRDGFEKREWSFIRSDKTRIPVDMVVTPLRDANGRLTGFLGVIEDARARHEMDRMKSDFTAVVSHELRTPLTSIRGSLGLILGALAQSLPTKVRELLEIAQSNCERLVLLVNDILDIEKFSAGQMRFDLQTVQLADLMRQAVQANEGYARKFQVRIALEHVDTDAHVSVDPDRFIQVMTNLLSNAAKYSPPNGTVRTSAGLRGEFVRISVHDDGPGIPEDFRARIFERFSQADSSTTRDKGGTGLGLHIARRFVEHMHGRIGFESENGGGTTFWVELPLATASAMVVS